MPPMQHVALDKLEPRLIVQMPQEVEPAGDEIVQRNHAFGSLVQGPINEVAADEARAPGHQDPLAVNSVHKIMFLALWKMGGNFRACPKRMPHRIPTKMV